MIEFDRPILTHADQLENHSSWRKVQRGLETIIDPEEKVDFLRVAARKCFLAYASLIMDFKLIVSPTHELLASAYEDIVEMRYNKLLVSICPRFGKSLFSQLLVSYLIGLDSSSHHIIGSYGLALSGKFSRGIINFTKHPEFKLIFPEFEGYEPGSKSRLLGGGEVTAVSPGSALTGFTAGSSSLRSKYPGVAILDDPLKNGNSVAKLKELHSWWSEEYSTRYTFNYASVVIATRFNISDAHGYAIEQDGIWDEDLNPSGWRYINIPALCENPETDPLGREEGESLWPSNKNFTKEALILRKNGMPESSWQSLFQGNPVAGTGGLVKTNHIVTTYRENLPKRFKNYYVSIDSAMSENEDADESVVTVLGIPEEQSNDKVYVVEMNHGNWSFPDLLEQVRYVEEKYLPRAIVVEKASSGYSLIQTYESELDTLIVSVRPSRSKQVRLQGVLHLFEQGKVVFVEDSTWFEKCKKQLLQFPKSIHDDFVDSLVYGLFYYLDAVKPLGNSDRVFQANFVEERGKRSVRKSASLIQSEGRFTRGRHLWS